MDTESELNLYDHVEFLAEKTNPRQESTEFSKSNAPKKVKKRKPSQAPVNASSNESPNVKFKLTANELLFIPKQYDPTPLRHPNTNDPNDYVRKRKYMEKIKNVGPNEQRQLRAKQDKRYLPHKANELSLLKTNNGQILCLDHLNGRCKAVVCDKYHQIRNPRLFGVCKYYIIGSCRAGSSCPYMHEEFPCRYYYLNIPHPKSTETEECRFKHGGPLPAKLCRYFKQQLEEWAKKITITQPDQFPNTFMNYTDKFDEKQAQLEQEYGVKGSCGVSMPSSSEQFSLEHILSIDQIKALAKRNVTNVAQVNQISVDELIDCGLTMDQIYKITINACEESNQNVIHPDHTATSRDSLSNTESNLNESLSSIESENSFVGFCDIDLNNAVGELECKKGIADDRKSINIATDSNLHECNQKKTDNFVNTQAADDTDGSSDSDDDFNLTIDEDVQ